MAVKILTVDDDLNICQLLNIYLSKEGYLVDMVNNGEEALEKLSKTEYNIILLDVMMPVMDGLETLRRMREQKIKTPVIFLTAKSDHIDKILGLDLGADDYLTKPFEPQELISRIKAILRRLSSDVDTVQEIAVDNLSISISSYIVKVDGIAIDMTPKEIDLVFFLATNPNKVYTRDQLLHQIWGKDLKQLNADKTGDAARTVDVHVKRIREKLGENHKWKLATVWGVGYKFTPPPVSPQ